jgi:HAD superfamily hydrolase (TIGR01509 family)
MLRRQALARLLEQAGVTVAPDELARAYAESGREADRWWREEQRGYRAEERIRWALGRLGVERPERCALIDETVLAVDEALVRHPAALLPGAADAVRRLAARYSLAIVSDTGFASGLAQDRLLERDGLLDLFAVRMYSCDVGHAKPHREIFRRAASALGVPPDEIVHVGNDERTDVGGALAAGLRAIRVDIITTGPTPSAAECVATSWEEVLEWLERS